MKYDPIKAKLGKFFNYSPLLRIVFYKLLDILLLRSWHVHYHLRGFFSCHSRNNPLNILDAGFGFGQYSWYMATKYPRSLVDGIELKDEQVEDCNHFFNQMNVKNVSFFSGDLTTFTKPQQYNLVLSVDVMEHIEEDEQVFRNFFQSMQPGGLLLISTPSDQGGSDVQHDSDESFIEEHVRDGYSINDITEKLKRAGFGKVETRYTYGKPGSLSWRLSMKYPILMLGKSSVFYIVLPIYYIVVMPLCLILNYFDVRITHQRGTGLLVKAYK